MPRILEISTFKQTFHLHVGDMDLQEGLNQSVIEVKGLIRKLFFMETFDGAYLTSMGLLSVITPPPTYTSTR